MANIIQQLKDNEKPFGLMSEEMQEKMLAIGFHDNFRLYIGPGFGGIIKNPDYLFSLCNTYRLRPDYEEEPEIVECEIQREIFTPLECGRFVITKSNHQRILLSEVCNEPDFVGFKFEDGQIWNSPINYSFGGRDPGFRTTVESITTNGSVVLHATHVLFRRNKP